MTNLQKVLGAVVLVMGLLGTLAFFGVSPFKQAAQYGATFASGVVQNFPFIFTSGFSAGSNQQMVVDASGNVSTTGNISASGGTATSTLTAGCIQATATSSATSVKIVLSTTGATSTFNGTAYWKYGTCP